MMMVNCEQGELVGIEGNKVFAFYNIPYGADQGRFMPVGEPVAWSGPRDAATPGSVFPQSQAGWRLLWVPKKNGIKRRIPSL